MIATMHSRGRRWLALGLGALVALAAGLAVVTVRSTGDEPSEPHAVDFADVAFPAVAWTGNDLLVYGGADDGPGRYSNAVALIDPASAEQVMLPEPPFDGALTAPASLLATDDAAVALGWLCSDPEPDVESCAPGTITAARLDLTLRQWATIEVPEPLRRAGNALDAGLGVTSDGRAVFAFTRTGGQPFWTYSLADGTWTALPSPGVPTRSACLAGDRVVAVVPTQSGGRSLAIFPLDGSDSWHMTAATDEFVPSDIDYGASLSCAGESAVIHDAFGRGGLVHGLDANASSLESPWRVPAPAPRDGTYSETLWTGSELIFLNLSADQFPAGGPALAYDPAADSWRELDDAPLASSSLTWTGEAVVGFAADANGTGVMPGSERLIWYVPAFTAQPPDGPTFSVVPESDLRDGQSVSVQGQGYRNNQGVMAVQCTYDDYACDQTTTVAWSTPGGSFDEEFTVRRHLATSTGDVDCREVQCALFIGGVGVNTQPLSGFLDFA